MKNSAKAGLKIIGEITLGLILAVCIATGFLAWRLAQGPINLDRATPYFVDYFNDTNNESVSIDTLQLRWDGFNKPLRLSASKVTVSNENGPFLYSPNIDLNVRIAPLFLGRFDLEAVWISKIAISITKHKGGEFTITGQSLEDTQDEEKNLLPASLTLNDLIYDLPDLDYFWIDDARILYRDEARGRTRRFEPVTLYIKNNRRNNAERNLSGFLSFPFGQDEDINIVKMNFETSRDPLLLNIYGEFEQTAIRNFLQFAPSMPEGLRIRTAVDANIGIQLDNVWSIHSLNAIMQADKGTIIYPVNAKTDSIDFSDLSLTITRDPKDDRLVIQNLSARINDEVPVALTGQFTNFTDRDEVAGKVQLAMSDLPQEYFPRYWPEKFSDNETYDWLVNRLADGTFPTLSFETEFDMAKTEGEDAKPLPAWLLSAGGAFTYKDMTIDYNAPMAKATNVSGTGEYKDTELTLDIAEADVGSMKTTNATLHFDNLISDGQGMGIMTFPVKAQAQDVFDYLAAAPINAFDTIDFKPTNTKGDVEAVVSINIPLTADLPIEDVEVKVEGTITNADVPDAVKGLRLSGGPYNFTATTGDIRLQGSGQIEGQPIDLTWHEYFSQESAGDYLSKITAELTANDKIQNAFIDTFSSHLKGPVKVGLDYVTDKNGRDTAIDLSLDLSDTAIAFQEIGLNKEAGQKTNASMAVKLVNGDLASLKNLTIKGDALTLANGDLDFITTNGNLAVTKASLEKLQFNKNNISVIAAQENGLLKTNITGAYLDVTPLLKGQKEDIEKAKEEAKTTSRPVEIGITVNELQTSNTATLKQPQIYTRLNGDARIETFELDAFMGQSANKGKLYIRYNPDVADGLSLRVESDNAGELFRTFDLYPYINGGTLQIAGRPLKGGRFGDVEGRARINDFEVTNAPVIIRLVNSLSFKNIFQGGALRFTRLESDFKWQNSDNGDLYSISNGQSSGAAIALTFDGFVNTATDTMEITGTAAPLSEINKLIGNIPIVGQILTGGSAFWAATYAINGHPDDPSVSVNPLSVITPGILRKLLFESTPSQSEAPMPEPEPGPRKLN